MKAVHGGKTKNDKIDSHVIAGLLRGGNFPLAYAYPQGMRSTRDLLRRRMHLMRKRAELLAHIQNTNTQYNLPVIDQKIRFKGNRPGVDNRKQITSIYVDDPPREDLVQTCLSDSVVETKSRGSNSFVKTSRQKTEINTIQFSDLQDSFFS